MGEGERAGDRVSGDGVSKAVAAIMCVSTKEEGDWEV
jgi:hypothetical protein